MNVNEHEGRTSLMNNIVLCKSCIVLLCVCEQPRVGNSRAGEIGFNRLQAGHA